MRAIGGTLPASRSGRLSRACLASAVLVLTACRSAAQGLFSLDGSRALAAGSQL